jgi:DNA-binding PadR family transcriptional regulator
MHSPLTNRAVVLQSLLKGECYGLELLTRLHARANGRVKKRGKNGKIHFYQGTIYPVLKILEKERLLASRVDKKATGVRGGRPRIYFRLTVAGRREALRQKSIALSFYKKAA